MGLKMKVVIKGCDKYDVQSRENVSDIQVIIKIVKNIIYVPSTKNKDYSNFVLKESTL